MPYLIDSDWVIDYLGGRPEALRLLETLSDEGVAVSILTYMEIYQGVIRSTQLEAVQDKLQAFLDAVPIIPVSPAVARRCARLREDLRIQGRRVNQRAIDLIIAATALEYDLTLVTRNTRDYWDVPGLRTYA